LPSEDTLLLDPRDELRGLFFVLEESPIMGGGGGGTESEVGREGWFGFRPD
jgi:hypothetical protein